MGRRPSSLHSEDRGYERQNQGERELIKRKEDKDERSLRVNVNEEAVIIDDRG